MNLIEAVRACQGTHKKIRNPDMKNNWLDAYGFCIKRYWDDGFWTFWVAVVPDLLRDDYEVEE